jgi:hypothetical protein
MKKQITAIILCFVLLLSCSLKMNEDVTTAPNNINTHDRVIGALTIASIGESILSAAKDAITGQIKGFLTSKIKNILGINTPTEVAPVDLSANALAEIRKIVATEIQAALNEYWFQSNHQDAQQKLSDIKTLYDRYVAEEQLGNPLSTDILWTLYYKCNSLNELTVFTGTGLNGNQVDKYWLTINTYALLVSLRYPILLEMHAKKLFLSKEQTVNDVTAMYNKLTGMQNALFSYCYRNVYITNSIGPYYSYSTDTLYDRIANKTYYFYNPYYPGGYGAAACALQSTLLSQYINQFGNYSQFLYKLQTLTDIRNYTSTDFSN